MYTILGFLWFGKWAKHLAQVLPQRHQHCYDKLLGSQWYPWVYDCKLLALTLSYSGLLPV